ncbi:PREDICTED: uncharacterized protein LOC106812824 [Priapulus caudatus]|uniref:Uncharacterized protein LOC106812824 n=1 Tax=Priapulus caudatus TaxID=37621 RepID=A0ABM1EJC0_PRICU|nr:PREDICTED: uncharacterized protein LOC106812824 [Priapulus caudatus]
MAQLHRFVRVCDRQNTQIFTFLLSRKVTRPLTPDIFTRDFIYGYHRWCLSFVRTEKHISVFLILRDVSDGVIVTLDYSVSLLHRHHFSKNETFSLRACRFCREQDTHGRKVFVSLDELLGAKYTDGNNEYLVELCMKNVRSTYEHVLPVGGATCDPQPRSHGTPRKYESTYFTFGNYDWSVCLFPNGDSNQGKPLICLTRHTHFEHPCKLRYTLTLGEGDRCMASDTIEHVFDVTGAGEGYVLNNIDMGSLVRQHKIKISMELLSVSTISEVKIPLLEKGRNCAQCYDRDKQAWAVVTEFDKGELKLLLFYSDARNVPRNYVRFVCWKAFVVTSSGNELPVLDGPFSKYYCQGLNCEDGYEMTTSVRENEKPDTPDDLIRPRDLILPAHIRQHRRHLAAANANKVDKEGGIGKSPYVNVIYLSANQRLRYTLRHAIRHRRKNISK